MPYRVDVHDAGPEAFDRLVELGALDAEVSQDGGIAALMPDAVVPERVARALGVDEVAVSPATPRDDGSVWALRPRPVHIGRLRIVPAHTEAGPAVLQLLDGSAFGTGLHPTTALCLEALDEIVQIERPGAVLDVGTGSGVLALAALMMGVPRATGIDIDGEALRIAAENARINRLDERLEVTRGGPEALTATWPLVVANVLAAPLIDMAAALGRVVGRGGQLVLSGFPWSLEPDVHQAYRRVGMRRVSLRSRAGWAALVLRASW